MKQEQTETRSYQEKFIHKFEFYNQIIDSLQDYSIFTTDKELRINSWNKGSKNLFGYETGEVIGKSCEIIFTQEDRNDGVMEQKIKTALQEGRVADSRWHVRKDGSLFYAFGVIFPLKDKEDQLVGFVKILRDLTEKRKSEEAIQQYVNELEQLNAHLEELNRHKDSILAILSHDLRSPLSTIVGIAHYLKTDLKNMEPKVIKQMVRNLYKASSDELDMLDYLLEWARIKYASEAFTPAQIDLHLQVKKIFETFQRVAAGKSIHLQNEVAKNTLVFADRKMIRSILQNLVSNSLQHSSHGAAITVTAKGIDSMMLVEVKDTGEGMSAQIQEQLFTPQLKTLSKLRKVDKGGGIGLLLVKGFIEKQGGEIWVNSVEGQGTSFYFTLPTEKTRQHLDSENKKKMEESE